MKRLLLCMVLFALVLPMVSCGQEPAAPASQPTTRAIGAAIAPAEFASLIGSPDHVLLDVRTPEEYAAGHLAGAILIDFHAPDFEQKLRELPRDRTYLVYCRSGRRSHNACQQMQELGFARLVDLQGGIQAWQKAGQPVEGPKP